MKGNKRLVINIYLFVTEDYEYSVLTAKIAQHLKFTLNLYKLHHFLMVNNWSLLSFTGNIHGIHSFLNCSEQHNSLQNHINCLGISVYKYHRHLDFIFRIVLDAKNK